MIESITGAGFTKILIVDDGSRDNTLRIAQSYPNTIVLSHAHNRGGGAALETGFEFVRRNATTLGIDYIVTFDADGQHSVLDMVEFIHAFEANPKLDMVLGSRFITKTASNVPLGRRIILWGGTMFTWMISGIKLTDSHNGYRMIAVKSLVHLELTMDGMEYASELIEQVRIHGLTFAEVPVNITYDEYTLAKGQRH